MMEKHISIIIPIYNSEEYLEECLESIKNQTYPYYEVLLIDDGSKDGSSKICKLYEESDERFHYYFQDNKGSSVARNVGIVKARYDVIAFVDADDWLEKKYLETMYHSMIQASADIVMCNILIDGRKEYPEWDDRELIGNSAIFKEYVSGKITNRVWNKLYKRDVIKNVSFPEGRNLMEDACWTAHVLENASVLLRISSGLYNYRVNENSQVHARRSEKVIVGSFANRLEKDRILLEKTENSDSEYEKLVVLWTLGDIYIVLESFYNLELWNVYKQLRFILFQYAEIMEKYGSKNDKYICMLIKEEENFKELQKKYLSYIIFHKKEIIKKVKLLVKYIVRNNR